MDRKTILVLVASFGLLFLWQMVIPKFFPPVPVQNTNLTATATSAGTNAAATNASITAPTATGPAAPLPPATAINIATNVAEQTETLETDDAIYIFTSHGGGLKSVQLKRYLETVGCDVPQGTNVMATLNDHIRVPILAMQADGLFGDNVFQLRRVSSGTVEAEKTLPTGVRVLKRFQLGSNYQVAATVRMENAGAQNVSLPAQQVSIGTATPMDSRDNMLMMGSFWFDGEKAHHVDHAYFEGTGGCIRKKVPRYEKSSETGRIFWGAVHNQFFAVAVVPATNAVASQFSAMRIDLPRATDQQIAADSKIIREPQGIEGSLRYPALTLSPNQVVERHYTIYAGPKQEKLLSRLGRKTDAIMDFGFFSAISKLMLRVMNVIHGLVAPIVPDKIGDYAIALVIMTILIKLVFWPLTQKSTRSMKRMQALAPEMKRIQEKYKDDPMKMNKKVMEFWREHKVSPMSGCWPMLIQLPIFFALFRMIPNAIELRGTPFLWACDLSKQDTVFMIPGFGFPINPLPILMGVTMLWQARLQPPSPGMDPAQQAIMKYMPLIFMVFLYSQPAGLTLYWTVQNLLTILQTKLTKSKDEPVVAPAPVAPPKKRKP
jgi:YidC/Oxa1 family membrane protein insertase